MSRRRLLCAVLTAVALVGLGAAPAWAITLATDTLTADDGQTITVHGTGLDPAKGYYLGICGRPPADGSAPVCVGTQNRPGTTIYLTNLFGPNPSPGVSAPIAADGSFTTTLTVHASGDNTAGRHLDCAVDDCGVLVRFDHTALTDRSADTFTSLTISPAKPASDTTTSLSAPIVTIIIIAGVALLAILVAVPFFAARRRRSSTK